MTEVAIDFSNCFGIEKLKYKFDFSKKNTYSIYAKNGSMKTSFANTFKKIQQGKVGEVCDKIFETPANVIIKIDDDNIKKEDVFVIKSFEADYESDISSLLVNDEIKTLLKDVLKTRDKFFKILEKKSGLKIKKTSQGRTVYSLESTILNDFSFEEQSILLNLDTISQIPEIDFSNVVYDDIFNDSVIKKIKSDDFQKGIEAFISKIDEVYNSFVFLEKGKFTLPKLKEIKKIIEKDNFFVKGNKLSLAGSKEIPNIDILESKIEEIETIIQNLSELKTIEQLLSDTKGMVLKDIIETHTDIIPFLKIDRLGDLRKILWLSYVYENKTLVEELKSKYSNLSKSIESASIDETPWKICLDIFKKRFTVPFNMEITNLKGAIIGESVPQIEFSFSKNGKIKKVNRSKLDELDTLSQGEKRALYLLNIIFDLEQIKTNDQETLLIIDDIADSFDYKNKYAIIEYLYELSKLDNIKMIILSHNFDFYRSVSSRLSILRKNRLFAITNNNNIEFVEEKYQNQPFTYWKKNLNAKYIIALIPFVRNLIEYGNDKEKSGESDFLFLTNLLHEKESTDNISFTNLQIIYKEYIGKDSFASDVSLSESIMQSLYTICDSLNENNNLLEDKVLLSMAIRHYAEKFMLNEIKKSPATFKWEENSFKKTGKKEDFLDFVNKEENQTRNLILGYNQIGTDEIIKLMSEVSIMTSENIHLNSFMYEPLLDMDIQELLNLYRKIKSLLGV